MGDGNITATMEHLQLWYIPNTTVLFSSFAHHCSSDNFLARLLNIMDLRSGLQEARKMYMAKCALTEREISKL